MIELGGSSRTVGRRAVETGPDRFDTSLHDQRLLPAVRELATVGASDRIFSRTQLAQEVQNGIGAGPLSPESKTVLPPAGKDVEPFPVLGKGQLDLDLLARGDAALETCAALQQPADERMVLG